MKILDFLTFAAALLVVTVASIAHADDPMTKITMRIQNGDQAESKNQTMYLWTPTKGRIEQPLDTAQNIQPLVICDGKDGWFIDLVTKTGQHKVDPSADHNFYAPIIPPDTDSTVMTDDQVAKNYSPTLRKFEFGHELEFMKGQKVTPEVITQNGTKFNSYSCTVDKYLIRLYVTTDTATPIRSEVWVNDKLLVGIDYSEYKSLPADPKLFAPPADVTIVDAP